MNTKAGKYPHTDVVGFGAATAALLVLVTHTHTAMGVMGMYNTTSLCVSARLLGSEGTPLVVPQRLAVCNKDMLQSSIYDVCRYLFTSRA